MGTYKKVALLLLLPLLAFGMHKFYVSVTNITYSQKDQAIQITSRVFIDDLEKVLEERYGFNAKLTTKDEPAQTDTYIEKYLRTKFKLFIDGELKDFEYLGRKYDNDVVLFYLEIEAVDLNKIKTIEVQNQLLTDLFDDQQNVVHFKIKGVKKSFVLIRENDKGMLNL